jgi:Acetyltransferase (GNAT) domain
MSNIRIAEYTIERLCADNITDVGKLHMAVYGKAPGPGLFLKKYDSTFTGVTHTGFIAYNSKQMPIAFYAVIPCYIYAQGDHILAAQSADTMTHPDFRNRGLFVKLANLTFQLCCTEGIRIIFGFPNQNSLPGFIGKLGWQMTERMDCFIIPSDGFSWQLVFRKLSFFQKSYISYREKQIKKHVIKQNGIANSVIRDGFAGVYRDEKYREYKTYNESYVIKINAATIWIKIKHEMLIGDILVEPKDFIEAIAGLKKLARKLGKREIHFHASQGTTLHGLFAARFKPVPSFPVIFKAFDDGIKTDKIKFTSADIDTF